MSVVERETLPAVQQPLELSANLQAGIASAKAQNRALMQLMSELLEPSVDYDRIPGTPKPTLLLPGAQQLSTVFHFCPSFAVADKTEILDEGKEFLSYIIICRLTHRETGLVVAEGIGSANSREIKYRYRYEGSGDGRHRVENQEIWDLQNTLVKMAKKRAFVDATLNATGASRLFTQDLEDLRDMRDIAPDGREHTARANGSRAASASQANGDTLRSEKQAGAIMGLLKRKFGCDDADAQQIVEILTGAPLDQLTTKQASALITRLNSLSDGAALEEAVRSAAAKRQTTDSAPQGGGR